MHWLQCDVVCVHLFHAWVKLFFVFALDVDQRMLNYFQVSSVRSPAAQHLAGGLTIITVLFPNNLKDAAALFAFSRKILQS